MYRIIGADGQQYGPVNPEEIRQWIADRRLHGQSMVQAQGSVDWKPLATFAEFADALSAHASIAPPSPPFAPPLPPLPPLTASDFDNSDYDLDVGGCISKGWDLFKNNLGLLLGAVAVYAAIEGVIVLLGLIPFVGPLFSLLNLFIVGPLMGGLLYLFLQTLRGQPGTVGDVFAGFRTRYLQLFLGQLVTALLAGLCMIPVVLAAVVTLLPAAMQNRPPGPAQVLIIVFVALICLIPMVWLQVNWAFTLPLIMDKDMEFWPAMQASWKRVSRHWWLVFGLVLLVGLLNLVGMLVCCVGALFTTPIGIGAFMYAYETLFGARRAQAA